MIRLDDARVHAAEAIFRAVVDLPPQQRQAALNERCGSDADLCALVEQLPAQLDVLVNNAGGNRVFDEAEPAGLAEVAQLWRTNLEANLISAVLVTEAVRDRLRAGGSVIHLGSISAQGYAFQVETTFRALRAGFRVLEVPIVFRDRRVGASKMSGSIVLEAALRVPIMRLSGRRDYTL